MGPWAGGGGGGGGGARRPGGGPPPPPPNGFSRQILRELEAPVPTGVSAPEAGLRDSVRDSRQRRDTGQAISRENVEVVRRAYEAFNRGGPDAQLAFIHPEVEFEEPDAFPDRQRQRGHDGYLASLGKVSEIFVIERVEAEEVIEAGKDRVIVALRAFGRSRGAEIPGDYRRFEVWTIRDGKAIHFEFYESRAEALEAVGLRE